MSATCHRPHLDQFFQENPFIHLSSFGGAALGCVAALAMLDCVTEAGFLGHVRAMAQRFATGFDALRAAYPLVADVRQRGLFIGFDLADDSFGPLMTMLLAQNGVLAVFANHRPSTIQILPPLILQADEVDFVLAALDRSLQTLVKGVVSIENVPSPVIH